MRTCRVRVRSAGARNNSSDKSMEITSRTDDHLELRLFNVDYDVTGFTTVARGKSVRVEPRENVCEALQPIQTLECTETGHKILQTSGIRLIEGSLLFLGDNFAVPFPNQRALIASTANPTDDSSDPSDAAWEAELINQFYFNGDLYPLEKGVSVNVPIPKLVKISFE